MQTVVYDMQTQCIYVSFWNLLLISGPILHAICHLFLLCEQQKQKGVQKYN